jgi:hypothetical protein
MSQMSSGPPAWALVFMAVQRAAKTGSKIDIEVATSELEAGAPGV